MSYNLDEYTFSWADNPDPSEDPAMQGLLDNEELPLPSTSNIHSTVDIDPFSSPPGSDPFNSPPQVSSTTSRTSHSSSFTTSDVPNGSQTRFSGYESPDTSVSISGVHDVEIRHMGLDRQNSFLGDHDPDKEETVKFVISSIIFLLVIIAFFIMIFVLNPAI